MNHRAQVPDSGAGQRLDQWLATLDFIPSRARALELIRAGLVTVDQQISKPSLKLRAGQTVDITLPPAPKSALAPWDAPLEILFQDADLAVINKPAGLVVHPAAGHAEGTLVNLLLHHLDRLSMGFGERRPGIVHRLDRDTSGLMVVAKNDEAHRHLAEQFRFKTAHRVYWAIVNGTPRLNRGTYRTHLARHPHNRKKFASASQGKLAVTHFEVLGTHASGVSWLELKLETGRTHQIRVHLSEAGLPIVADPVYGPKRKSAADKNSSRLGLHAHTLGFTHPRTGEKREFHAPWPADLANWQRVEWNRRR